MSLMQNTNMDKIEQKAFERKALRAVAAALGETRRATFMRGSMFVSTDATTAEQLVSHLEQDTGFSVEMRPATDPPGKIYIFSFS